MRIVSSSRFGGAPGEVQSSISPKTMPRTPFSLPALTQLPQHAVDLVGLGADVFEEQQLVLCRGSHGVPSSETRMLRHPP